MFSATSAVASLSRLSPSRIDDDAPRHPDPPGHRRGGDRVRRRDDGADGEAGSERDPGRHPPGHVAHHDRCAGDQRHRQQQDRPTVGLEVDQRRADRGGVQQRRQQSDEDEVRCQLDVEEVRDEGQPDADDHEGERFRPAEASREARYESDDRDQGEDVERGVHSAIVLIGW